MMVPVLMLLLACVGDTFQPAAALMASLDTNGDGVLQRRELAASDPDAVLERLDTDGSSTIDLAELTAGLRPE